MTGDSAEVAARRVVAKRLGLEETVLDTFSDEAMTALASSTQAFTSDVVARARNSTSAEMVLKGEVDRALASVRPSAGAEVRRIVSDWAKRLGFLFGGLGIAQFQVVDHQKTIAKHSVVWLLVLGILAAICITTGVVLDRVSANRRS